MFVLYALLVVLLLAILILWAAPAHGKSNIMVYVAICSLLGSFTVPSSKGIGLVAEEVFVDGPSNSRALALFLGLVGTLAVSILIQFYFINKALESFSSNNFEARYYVAFTSSVILASAVLFREWTALTLPDICHAQWSGNSVRRGRSAPYFRRGNNYLEQEEDGVIETSSHVLEFVPY